MSLDSSSHPAGPPCSFDPPIPSCAHTVLLFGGAFDPPHCGHIELPQRALVATNADWLLYLPAARTPLKDDVPSAPADDRVAMLRQALAGQPRTSVCDLEIRRGGACYTLDTLLELRKIVPQTITFRLLIGADQAANFHQWREPRDVIALAEPVVMLRTPDESSADLLEKMRPHWSAPELTQWEHRIAPTPLRKISSSRVRSIIKADGPSAPELESILPPVVRIYITAHGLYTDRPAP